MGAAYTVSPTTGGGSSGTTTTTTTEKKSPTFDTLRDKFESLANGVNSLENNRFATDFFASVRVNVQGVLDTIFTLITENATALDKALEFWEESRPIGQGAAQKKNANVKPSIVRWKEAIARPNYGELKKMDKEIEICLERGKIYRDLGAQCRLVLGLRRSVVSKRYPLSPKEPLERAFYDDDGGDSSELLPPLSWDRGLATSPFLNLDWDDDNEKQLEWSVEAVGFAGNPGTRLRMPDSSNLTLFESINRARIKWLRRVRNVFVSLDNMTGLYDMKEQIGKFVLEQIVFPASPILSGAYVNFVIGGNPGTGKTEVARRFPVLLYLLGLLPVNPFHAVYDDDDDDDDGDGDGKNTPDLFTVNVTTRNDWIAEYEGQTATKTRQLLLKNLGSLIVIDEAYSLVLSSKDSYGLEFINQLVNDMSLYRGLISVMLLGYADRIEKQVLSANDGLNRRFNNRWIITNYSGAELFVILMHKLVGLSYRMPGVKKTVSTKDQRDVFLALAKVLPLTTSGQLTTRIIHKDFKPTKQELDHYDSIFNILVGLQSKTGLFANTNAAAIPGIIKLYNGAIVSRLVLGDAAEDSKKRVTLSQFDEFYKKMGEADVKQMDLVIFIQILVGFAAQNGARTEPGK
jgi:hypothetical protein